jgi:hypothetical protein
MKRAWVVAMAMVAACGTKAATPGTSVPDGAYVAVDAADTAGDATVVDATASDSGATDAGQDAAADGFVLADSPLKTWCAAKAKKICAKLPNCCATPVPDCELRALLACVDDDERNEASASGQLVLDPAVDASCTAAFEADLDACEGIASYSVNASCVGLWRDVAALGEPCHVSNGWTPACAGGKGTCTLVQPPDGYQCIAGHDKGESCSATLPCNAPYSCNEGTLTRAKTCGVPFSSCNLSDTCWPGDKCDQGNCVHVLVDKGAPCQKDADCKGLAACEDGKCASALCKMLAEVPTQP